MLIFKRLQNEVIPPSFIGKKFERLSPKQFYYLRMWSGTDKQLSSPF